MEITTLKAEPRTEMGTRAARALRDTGSIPVIIYGHGETPESITLDRLEVEKTLAHGARMLGVELGGKSNQYLIKEVQYDHMGATPVHMDLARVALDEKVTVSVGIELRGVAKGISDGGVMDQVLASIDIECLVTQIPDTLHPSVTHLELGESLYVKDLELPEGVTPQAEPDDRIATVRELVESAASDEAEDGEEGAAEPERIGRVRKDDEEGDEGK